MSDDPKQNSSPPRAGSWLLTLVACALVAAGAVAVTHLIKNTQPTAQRTTETRRSAMLVEVVEVTRGSYRPTISAVGTVVPSRDIVLSPQVTGRLVERVNAFSPGGTVDGGTTLVKIDPSDYEITLAQRLAALAQANADLEIEMGRQKVAALDLELLDESLASESQSLVLRQPQLSAAKAAVESARAAVTQAETDLARCEIRAPFDAQILERKVDVGSRVDPGDELGRLVGLDTYWVEATIPIAALPWIDVPQMEGQPGAEVKIRDRAAWPAASSRPGTVYRLIGTLDDRTRLARLLVTVDDPLSRKPSSSGLPRLVIGSLVETAITGRELPGVVRLERAYLRENDTVWLMEDGRLRIAETEVVFRDEKFAYIAGGLEAGDAVVTTPLASVTEGASLRTRGDESP